MEVRFLPPERDIVLPLCGKRRSGGMSRSTEVAETAPVGGCGGAGRMLARDDGYFPSCHSNVVRTSCLPPVLGEISHFTAYFPHGWRWGIASASNLSGYQTTMWLPPSRKS